MLLGVADGEIKLRFGFRLQPVLSVTDFFCIVSELTPATHCLPDFRL
jgi:hypothetical protein